VDQRNAPEPPDLAALAERLTAELRAQGVAGNTAYDQANQRLINESIDPISVAGLVLTLSRAPEAEHDEVVRRYVAAHLRGKPTIETWAEAREKVLPRIRPEIEQACWGLRSGLEGWALPSMPTGPVTEHLRVQFVWEVEDAFATVHADDVERWGVTLDELQDAASANLGHRTPSPAQWMGNESAPGVFRSSWADGFDATRVLFAGGLGLPAEGPLVAIAPNDSTLLLADSSNESAVFHLGLTVQRLVQETKQMVWLWPLLLDGDVRRHWLPEESSAAFAPMSVCAAIHAQLAYQEHGALLQRALDAENAGIRVGLVGMAQSPLGSAVTVAVWEEGTPVALGHADLVQFRRGETVLGMAPWAKVEEVLGDALEAIPGYPARYRVTDFPEDWQLTQMELFGG